MKLYNKEDLSKLLQYKDTLQNEEIKEIISKLVENYNYMYIKLKDKVQKKIDIKKLYEDLDNQIEKNKELEARLERKLKHIEVLKKEIMANEIKIKSKDIAIKDLTKTVQNLIELHNKKKYKKK